ncbi:MAG: hypothetical protein MJ101_05655 [Clostridia bacterium]|nr:hypothetical protein [Clostridia bacterium]
MFEKEYEIISGCKVYTYSLDMDDTYGSNINEELLMRKRRRTADEQKVVRFSYVATHTQNVVRRAAHSA